MFDAVALANGFANVFTDPTIFLLILIGVIGGLVFGMIPGLSYGMAVTLCLPLTFSMGLTQSICLFMGIMIGGVSGGLISAILLNMPGTPSSVATTLDGYPLAKRGEAGKALGYGILYSFVGGMIGVAALLFLAPSLAKFTIKFGPIEYFAITVFSLTLIANLTRGGMVKGISAALLGISISMVGMAPIDGTVRYTLGNRQLISGFALIPLTIGLFSFVEVMKAVGDQRELKKSEVISVGSTKGFGITLKEINSQWINAIRSSFIGIVIGILPGIGSNAANLVSYSIAKDSSKHPEKFGTGCIDGIVASEAANNACLVGAQIPLLALGIPGDANGAKTLAAFMLHGVVPGPLLFKSEVDLVYTIFAAIILANILFVVLELGGLRIFVKLMQIKKYILFPIIMILCVVGAFASNNNLFDVYCLLGFSVLGYIMYRLGLPATPFTLGYLLGGMVEDNMMRALMMTNGDWRVFMTKPIAMVFFAATLVSLVYSAVKEIRNMRLSRSTG